MDDSFQFIIESPQNTLGQHKKRPRLVTSCDNCRLKKIKCIQATPDAKCEACKTGKVRCSFRDRERYFAERSRSIAGGAASERHDASMSSSSSSPAMSSYSVSRSESRSPKASGIVGADDGGNVRYSPYASDPRRPAEYPHRHVHSSSLSYPPRQSPLNYHSPSPSPMMYHSRSQSQSNPRQLHLFDSENPQQPSPSLMSEFILNFFQHCSPEYPFLSYDDTWRDFTGRRISPALANSIAAFAVHFSANPDIRIRGLHDVSETYTSSAKTAVNAVAHIPSVETLHAMILIFWLDYKANRMSGCRDYAHLIARMSVQLGLTSSAATHDSSRRALLQALYRIQMTTSQFR